MTASHRESVRTAPALFSPTRLIGRVVRFYGPAHELRTGLVRRQDAGTVTVQAPSNPDAVSASARYRGRRRRVPLDQVAGFWFRSRFHALELEEARS